MNVSQAAANLESTGLNGASSANTSNSTLKFYNGSIAASPETAVGTQTLLATVALPTSASAMTSSNGVLTAAAISAVTIAATGTTTWCRWASSTPTTLADMYVANNSGYSAWATGTAYTAGTDIRTANGATWICTTSGTSASTGTGPQYQGPQVKDGTAVWSVVDILLSSTSLVSGAQLSITSFTYTVPSV
jgi:hypothetical protein